MIIGHFHRVMGVWAQNKLECQAEIMSAKCAGQPPPGVATTLTGILLFCFVFKLIYQGNLEQALHNLY